MKALSLLFVSVGCLLFAAGRAQAQPRQDPMSEAFFPPQLLIERAEELGLDTGQIEFVRGELEKAQERFPELQQNLRRETAALAEVLKQDHPEEQKVLEQLDKVLEDERQIKHAQMSLSLAIRSKLKPEQIAKIREIQKTMVGRRGNGQAGPEALQAKIQQIQERMRAAQENGLDISDARPVMEELRQFMQAGKFKEAEEAADRLLKALGDPGKK